MAPSFYSPGALTGAVKHPQDTLGRTPEAVGPRLENLPGSWLKSPPTAAERCAVPRETSFQKLQFYLLPRLAKGLPNAKGENSVQRC